MRAYSRLAFSLPVVFFLGSCAGDTERQSIGPGVYADVNGRADGKTTEPTVPDGGTTKPDPGKEPVKPSVGDFGEPCGANADCESGYCVEGPVGSVCTQPCLEECPEDYACKGLQNDLGADLIFLCVPIGGVLCEPCSDELQCNGGRCVRIEDKGACTIECSTSDDCPTGSVCTEAEPLDGGDPLDVCVPQNGTCTCDPGTDGFARTCTRLNEHGKCQGIETCDATAGWVGCTAATPSQELCDGVDNDCNGLVDDELPTNKPCFNTVDGVGSCEGVSVCGGQLGWVCQAASPAEDLCDYVDNDCDGKVDDPYMVSGMYGTIEHCGACNKSCVGTVPNGTAACLLDGAVPTCGVDQCDPGFFPVNGKQCLAELQTLCQSCASPAQCYYPGAACIELEDGSYCTKPCTKDGDCPSGFVCSPVAGFGPQCVPSTGSCTCDGSNLALQRECQVTVGGGDVPEVTCTGVEPCTLDGWGACELPEDVCDGLDNDCDGSIDEGFKDAATGKYSTSAHCGQCNNSCQSLTFPSGVGVCNVGLAVPACAMECNAGFFDVNQNPTDGCECHKTSSTDLPYGLDANCDGVDGEVQNAIFVAKNGLDSNPGTLTSPVFTIGQGIVRAKAKGKRDVYVATGVYVEAIDLAQGVGIYGGYSADFVQHEPEVYETAVIGPPPVAGKLAAVHALGLGGVAGATRFDGFTVFGPDGVDPGASSVGIYVKNCTEGVAITNNHIVAGNGALGFDGASGTHGGDGSSGKGGKTAYDIGTTNCTAGHHNAGATGGSGSCGGVNVGGGKGGNAICPDWDESGAQPKSDPVTQQAQSQEAGTQGSNNSGTWGAGGTAGFDGAILWSTTTCNICHIPPDSKEDVGGSGGHGKPGGAGSKAGQCTANAGMVIGGQWVGNVGGSGGSGGHGGGGGGGGAGGGVETQSCGGTIMKYDDIGGSGGGGGAGGCGGSGGSGGGAGGGSFGIFVVYTAVASSLPNLSGNVVERGNGGGGGHGGAGGVGGDGGSGGTGGDGGSAGGWATFCASNAGTGGDGGDGGHGGGGAGGCGGVSYGVYASGQGGLNVAAWKTENTVVTNGGAGAGGPGGFSLGQAGTNGSKGAVGKFNF